MINSKRTSDLAAGDRLVYSAEPRIVDVVTSVYLPELPCVVARIEVDRHLPDGRIVAAHFYAGVDAEHELDGVGPQIRRFSGFFPFTVARTYAECINLFDTVESAGSVVTHLSTMGTTIVKGR